MFSLVVTEVIFFTDDMKNWRKMFSWLAIIAHFRCIFWGSLTVWQILV